MKLMVVSGVYHPHQVGGAEKMARLVAERMAAAGHRTVVATTVPGPGDRTRSLGGVRVHDIGLRNLYWPHGRTREHPLLKPFWHALNSRNPFMERALGRVLDEEKPDVMNTHSLAGFSAGAWRAAARRDVPVVHVLHDYSLLCPRTSMFRDGHACQRQCSACALLSAPNKALSAGVEAVIGVSRFTLQRHLDAGYFPRAARQGVIHNAVPCAPPEGARSPGPGPLRLGYVGQLTPAKGVKELVAHMHRWPAQACTLVVAGKGWATYEAELRRLAPPHVTFVGVLDPAEVYRRVDVLVVPSLWEEPFGLVVLEAYGHGIPVIATRRGGLPEIVDHLETGYLYDPADGDGLATAITAFLRDPLLRLRLEPAVRAKAAAFRLDRLQSDYLSFLTAAARVEGLSA